MKVTLDLNFLRGESKKSNKTGNVYHLANFLTNDYETIELNVADQGIAEKLFSVVPMTPLAVDIDLSSGRFGIYAQILGFSEKK